MRVLFHPNVLKQLQRLPRADFETALRLIIALSHEARPAGAKKLVGSANDWRVRFGQYRIVYSIDDDAEEILVYIVAKRSDAYR
ncbi:MAG TPA: type II toxin-antitoxin system RelE/ParE family toxin [Mycobacterium sp.]|jgi:mRNA interferase RelE/StbE